MKRLVRHAQGILRAIRGSRPERYLIAEILSRAVSDEAVLPERDKAWMTDVGFWSSYRRLAGNNLRRGERLWNLRELAASAAKLSGHSAECGVFEGAGSYFICEGLGARTSNHYLCDAFAGLSEPGENDGEFWAKGDLTASETTTLQNLAGFPNIVSLRGWIPDRFNELENLEFRFVHIDVDLFQPTLDSISFFYPRMVRNGLIVCDDYGFLNCPGATRAIDQYMGDKPEHVVRLSTGQALVIRN